MLSRRMVVRVAAIGSTLGRPDRVSLGSGRGPIPLVVAWIRLLVCIIAWKPRIIEFHNIPVGLPTILLFGGRYVFHGPAGLEARAQNRLQAWVVLAELAEAVCIRRASSLHCVSPQFRNLLRTRVIGGQSGIQVRRVIPPKLLYRTPLRKTSGQELEFVVCRRLVYRTGVDLAIRAFAHAALATTERLRMTIIGEGPQAEELRSLATSLDFGNSIVQFLGRTNDAERDAAYERALANVVPTRSFEGFGLVVVEAAFCGCPSIVTRVDALPWVVNRLGGIGIVVDPTVESLANGLMNCVVVRWSPHDRASLQALAARRFGTPAP